MRFNEQVKQYYDSDSEESIMSHFNETGEFAMLPMHVSLKIPQIDLGIATLQAELLYALNGMNISSGHSMGVGIGAKLHILDNLSIPLGLGAAFFEKNIDTFTSSAIETSSYESFYGHNGYSKADSYTLGMRQALRAGFGAGVEFSLDELLKLDFNVGFAYSQIAHIYRDTLQLLSASAEIRALFLNTIIVGGGIVFGSLTEEEWVVKDSIANAPRRPGESTDRELFEGHTFSLMGDMGFEVYLGMQMQKARFILGYNMNRGISMSRFLEALPDAQQKYRQAGTEFSEGLFERGGVFAKLIINL
jgi:hypothetical protein